ncbi:MAG: sensor histidine kinase [Micromonosporaceae bacterium]|nr:sensor histidine kinase [Micromonosporaceae bacterium]
MRDLILIVAMALASALVVWAPGVLALRLLRHRSIVIHICGLVVIAVLAMLAGIVAVAQGMFISAHDLNVLMIVLAASGVVSLTIAILFSRRLAADAMWAHEARERERQVEAGRRELVAWVSHDLRTPLAGLRAMAEALEDGVVTDPATVADYLRRMRLETDRMAHLVDDLFELSRINAGALNLTPTATSLGDVISDAVAAATPVAQARRVTLRAAPAGWPTVRASEPELGRIVANLLSNAIQYTPAGGTIVVSGGSEDGYGWFAVTDGCGGIAEADLPRVFDVAYRSEAARTPRATDEVHDAADAGSRDTAGGGLGLAIVRGLVEAHGGRVSVANIDGGCRFEVRLPTG